MEKKNFKLILLIVILFISLFLIAGCESREESQLENIGYNEDIETMNNKVDEFMREINNTSNIGNENNSTISNETSDSKSVVEEEEDDDFDFSGFEKHGKFSEGLCWVEVSDYTGVRRGYINREGEYVMPLTDEVKTLRNFEYGTAIISVKDEQLPSLYGGIAIINPEIEILGIIEDTCGSDVMYKYFNNGNILLGYPVAMGIPQAYYMYITKEQQLIRLTGDDNNVLTIDACEDYVDGWVYSGDEFNSNGMYGGCVRFIDEEGNCALYLGRSIEGRESNENYNQVYSASDFVDGKSNIIFQGKNYKRYTVTIDKQGNWLTEPVEVADDYRVR